MCVCVCVCVKNLSMYVWCGLSSYMHTIRERERERESERSGFCVYECDERNEPKRYMCWMTKAKKFNFYYNEYIQKKRMIFYAYIKKVRSHLFI
jgi:hypothetical protein